MKTTTSVAFCIYGMLGCAPGGDDFSHTGPVQYWTAGVEDSTTTADLAGCRLLGCDDGNECTADVCLSGQCETLYRDNLTTCGVNGRCDYAGGCCEGCFDFSNGATQCVTACPAGKTCDVSSRVCETHPDPLFTCAVLPEGAECETNGQVGHCINGGCCTWCPVPTGCAGVGDCPPPSPGHVAACDDGVCVEYAIGGAAEKPSAGARLDAEMMGPIPTCAVLEDGVACTGSNGDPGKCGGGSCCTGCYNPNSGLCNYGVAKNTCGRGGDLCENCDDGRDCTTDACIDYTCVNTSTCADSNDCTADHCTSVGCKFYFENNGTPCNGSGECITGGVCQMPAQEEPSYMNAAVPTETTSAVGSCQLLGCNDGNRCTEDSCTSLGCVYLIPPPGRSCSTASGDGLCNSDGHCVRPDAPSCQSMFECPISNRPCMSNVCPSGFCSEVPSPDGVSCDGGAGECVGGECLTRCSSYTDCPAPSECHAVACAGGLCRTYEARDGSNCLGGFCYDGVCY